MVMSQKRCKIKSIQRITAHHTKPAREPDHQEVPFEDFIYISFHFFLSFQKSAEFPRSGIWTVCAVRVLLPSLSAIANFVNVMATISVVSRPLRYMQVQMNTQYCPNPLNEAVNSTGA